MTTPIHTIQNTPTAFGRDPLFPILLPSRPSAHQFENNPHNPTLNLKRLERRHYDRPIQVDIQRAESSLEFRTAQTELYSTTLTFPTLERKTVEALVNQPSSEKGVFENLSSLFGDLLDFLQKPLVTEDQVKTFLSEGLKSLGLEDNPVAKGIVASWSATLSSVTAPQNLVIGATLVVFPQLIPVMGALGTAVGGKEFANSSWEGFQALQRGDTEAASRHFTDAVTNGLGTLGSLKLMRGPKLSTFGSSGKISVSASVEKNAARMVEQTLTVARQEAKLEPSITLKFDPQKRVWISRAGLVFTAHKRDKNSIQHVLKHLKPVTSGEKNLHTVFNVSRKELLPLLDEAWVKRDTPTPSSYHPHREIYIIDMKREVGTHKETHIQIVVKKNTSKVISAYLFETL